MSLLYVLTGGGVTTPVNSNDLAVGSYKELSINLTLTSFTGGTAPSITVKTNVKGGDGVYYTIDNPAALTAAGTIQRSLGAGVGASPTTSFGDIVQFSVVITGSPTAAVWSLSVTGK